MSKALSNESCIIVCFKVSFQESESVCTTQATGTVSREFPIMLRRGSIAPLAARIRANRPPTAPPGSIFTRQEFQLRYLYIIIVFKQKN